ncbi:MAG: hypothetical protein Q7R48_03810 [bacterium]|nr:hypothetical protein [bacterium]
MNGELLSMVLVVSIMLYAFSLILMGPKRSVELWRKLIVWIVPGVLRLLWYATRLLLLSTLNTMSLVIRLVNERTPTGRGDALANYAERMSDALFTRR